MSTWRLPCVHEEVWIAAKHALPSGPEVVVISARSAAWQVDAWFGSLGGRPALLEIGRWLGEPSANGAIALHETLKARVRSALGQGGLVAFRREHPLHAVSVGRKQA